MLLLLLLLLQGRGGTVAAGGSAGTACGRQVPAAVVALATSALVLLSQCLTVWYTGCNAPAGPLQAAWEQPTPLPGFAVLE